MDIDRSKPVLVTGATGYVAGWLIKRLMEEGLTVHGTVRNPNNKAKIAHLMALNESTTGQLKLFKADLLTEGAFKEAMEGCELVYHTASPFSTAVDNPQKDLIEPAVHGTANVLEEANNTNSVKRVVVTSSCAAIYTDCVDVKKAPQGVLTEEVWNTSASLDYQPYSYSKTLAEKEAWKRAEEQKQWDLVVVNPCLVMGPPLNPKYATSESMSLLKQMGDGTMKFGVPNIGCGIVDVRDLAEAHFQAGFTPEAEGRHIICGHNSSFLEMAQILHEVYGSDYPISDKALPKWLLMLVGPMVNKAITREFVKKNVNLPWTADNSKSKEKLGLTYRPLKDTMVDSFSSLVEHQLV